MRVKETEHAQPLLACPPVGCHLVLGVQLKAILLIAFIRVAARDRERRRPIVAVYAAQQNATAFARVTGLGMFDHCAPGALFNPDHSRNLHSNICLPRRTAPSKCNRTHLGPPGAYPASAQPPGWRRMRSQSVPPPRPPRAVPSGERPPSRSKRFHRPASHRKSRARWTPACASSPPVHETPWPAALRCISPP